MGSTPAGPGAGTPGVGQTDQQAGGSAATPNPLQAQPQSLTGDVIGGNIIGVLEARSSNRRSGFMSGGDTYQKWEFIYNPMQLGGIPGQSASCKSGAPTAPGQQPQGAPGQQLQNQQQNTGNTNPQQPAPQPPSLDANAPATPPA